MISSQISRRLFLSARAVRVPVRLNHKFTLMRDGGHRASSGSDDFDTWPVSKRNTILNVCPQGQIMLVERLGKLNKIEQGGLFFAFPIIDDIRFVVDMRERALAINPQATITKDNVHVAVSGNLFLQFVDPEKAAYGSSNPIYSVRQHAQSAMRAAIGELELDEILHARVKLNETIKAAVQQAAEAWGLEIKRYEITEIAPDKVITDAMDKQAAAERERRKRVIEAEGDKRSAELESEGNKIRMKNESEGAMIEVENAGRAEAAVIKLRANAQAEAIRIIAEAIEKPGGAEAAKLQVAKEYISMYGEMGQNSNTMIFSSNPADVNALMAQASSVFQAVAAKKSSIAAPGASPSVENTNKSSGEIEGK